MKLPVSDNRDQMVELAKELGLDPNKITNISAESDGGPWRITYEGMIVMSFEDFKDLLNKVYKATGSNIEVR